jgi:hypothetical protein
LLILLFSRFVLEMLYDERLLKFQKLIIGLKLAHCG